MNHQATTYQREKARKRTDWSSEVTAPYGAGGMGAGDMGSIGGMGTGGMGSIGGMGAGGMDDALSVSDANSGVTPTRHDNGETMASQGPQVVNGQELSQLWPDIENNLPNDVIEAPTTMEEVYRGSMKALLLRNIGNYVVATFLIGTQTTVSWEGILYDVGNDYLAIYQSGRDQYIVSDLYSLKYVEFYDTRRRELCDALLTEQRPSGNSQR